MERKNGPKIQFLKKMLRTFYENGYNCELCSLDGFDVGFCRVPAS